MKYCGFNASKSGSKNSANLKSFTEQTILVLYSKFQHENPKLEALKASSLNTSNFVIASLVFLSEEARPSVLESE